MRSLAPAFLLTASIAFVPATANTDVPNYGAQPDPLKTGAHRFIKGSIEPPKTILPNGQEVRFISVTPEELAETRAYLTHSMHGSYGDALVFYAEESMAELSPAAQLWFFKHEIAHFENGDYTAQAVQERKHLSNFDPKRYLHEDNADCSASKAIVEYGFTTEEAQDLSEELKTVFEEHAPKDFSGSDVLRDIRLASYSSPEKRANIVVECFAQKNTSLDFTQ